MYVLSVFELSSKVEEAVTALQTNGVLKDSILVVPMKNKASVKALFDTAHYSDNDSPMTPAFIVAMLCAFFGVIFGFQLNWGPILWGAIGGTVGFAVGLGARLLWLAVIKHHTQGKNIKDNVVVLINCDHRQSAMVEDVLWNNSAIGVNSL
jgi:hypothetical protein